MDQYIETLKNIPVYYLIIPAIFVLYGIFAIINGRKQKARKADFLAQNPTASTIQCEQAQKGIRSVSVNIQKINNEYPSNWVQDGFRITHMLLPGTYVLEVEASSRRPGVMHKSVTHTYGPVKLEVVVEAARKYVLGFDPKAENFTFTEV